MASEIVTEARAITLQDLLDAAYRAGREIGKPRAAYCAYILMRAAYEAQQRAAAEDKP